MNALGLVRKYYPGVMAVVDAEKPVRVDITKEDSVKGTKKAPNKCAMARAVCRDKSYTGAIISTSVAYLIQGDKALRFKTPEAVSREIISFDRHADFAPGRYSLKPPGKTDSLAGRKVYSNGRGGPGSKNRPRTDNDRTTRAARLAEDPKADMAYKNHKTTGVRSLN